MGTKAQAKRTKEERHIMAASKGSKVAIWILMGLLILGLGGFGATNFSSTVRSVGSVGDQDISTMEYGRALQEEMRAIESQMGQSLSFEQAQAFGLPGRTLSRLVADASLDNEAERIGLSVGDEILGQQLQNIPAFRGIDGNFDRETYSFALDRAGMSETEFENSLRDETARTLLQGAVVSGKALPDSYIDTMLTYLAERRRVTWARVSSDEITGPTFDPSEEDLRTLYENEIDRFTLPERKIITYAWLTPEMILDDVELDPALIEEEYEARSADFNKPERRLVERLVYANDDAAQEAATRLENGEVGFEDLVLERGLVLADIDMGDVTQSQLGEAGEAVFAAESGDVVGPEQTNLGPALFRINGILSAEVTPLEDAQAMIREELAFDRASRRVSAEAEPVEDLLAAGATLEELAQETDMQLDSVEWAEGQTEGIASYEGFEAAAKALQEGDFPEIMQLTDGGIFAMRLDEVIAPEPAPFDDVRDRVLNIWETRRNMERLNAVADDYIAKLGEAADFASLGLEAQTEEALIRDSDVLGTPPEFVTRAFQMQPGEISKVDAFGSVLILKLDEILPPNLEDPDTAALRDNLQQRLSTSVSQDIYRAFAEDARTRAGVDIDQTAINAVHANFQ